jgi:hypothetical protein
MTPSYASYCIKGRSFRFISSLAFTLPFFFHFTLDQSRNLSPETPLAFPIEHIVRQGTLELSVSMAAAFFRFLGERDFLPACPFDDAKTLALLTQCRNFAQGKSSSPTTPSSANMTMVDRLQTLVDTARAANAKPKRPGKQTPHPCSHVTDILKPHPSRERFRPMPPPFPRGTSF